MKKILIKVSYIEEVVEVSNKMSFNLYKYYDNMLFYFTVKNYYTKIGMIELIERDILGYLVRLNTYAFFILKRSKQEAIIALRKNNRTRYYVANKVFNKYYADFGYIFIKENNSRLINKYDDIAIYLQNICLKIKFKDYDYIYENNNLNIYKINRIID